MISQIYRSLLTIGLISFLSFAITFGNVENSWASTQVLNFVHPQIAVTNGIKAVTKGLEGKAQEAIGKVTGSIPNQVEGKAKQAEASSRNTAEDVKSKAKEAGNVAKRKAKDIKNAID